MAAAQYFKNRIYPLFIKGVINPVLVLDVVAKPEEQLLYENVKQKSHYLSLRDQLKFLLKPDLRSTHESYISQQATTSGYQALAPSNWQDIPDLTVANLYWYFKAKNELETATA